MNKGTKVFVVINGKVKEATFGKPNFLVYLKKADGSRARFVSHIFANKKDAEKGVNAVQCEIIKPAKVQWYENILSLFKGAKQ